MHLCRGIANIRITVQILFVILILSTSCNEWLELKPIDDLVQDEYWQTKEDVEAILMGAYAKFSSMDDKLFIFGEFRGDMIEPSKPTDDQLSIIEGQIEPNNSECKWNDFYEVINYCNYVLEFSDLVRDRDPTYTDFQAEGYKSEALFLRSLSYFYLVRIFKDVPLVLNSSQTDDQNFFVPKSDETTILNAITEDLLKARRYAPDNYPNNLDNKSRATKSAIHALLADISLWQFKYIECIEYCDEIINPGTYHLVHGSQWFSLYYPGNTLESVFEFQSDEALGQANRLSELTYFDERIIASIYAQELLGVGEQWRTNGSFSPGDFIIWKYVGAAPDGLKTRSSGVILDANLIVYRLADILLMKAEALNQLGNIDDAMDILNEIRSRAEVGTLNKPSSINDMEDLILEERARELAFEGKRYFDLIRMGRRDDFQRKDAFIERIIQNVTPSQRFVLATKLNDPNGWFFPIHLDELEANISLVQNPYYESLSNY